MPLRRKPCVRTTLRKISAALSSFLSCPPHRELAELALTRRPPPAPDAVRISDLAAVQLRDVRHPLPSLPQPPCRRASNLPAPPPAAAIPLLPNSRINLAAVSVQDRRSDQCRVALTRYRPVAVCNQVLLQEATTPSVFRIGHQGSIVSILDDKLAYSCASPIS
jgi:hypothetical protein